MMQIIYKKRNTTKRYGGKVASSPVLEKILSIGFEFETGNMIPVLFDKDSNVFTVTRIEPDKLPIVKIKGKIDLHITSDADTPLNTGGVHSSISEMEQKYLNPENQKFRDFIDKYIYSKNADSDKYNFYNHTEYMFTFLKSRGVFNDDNIVLRYFSYVIKYLMTQFKEEDDDMKDKKVNTKLKIFSNHSLLYMIPMKFRENLTPSDIKWVPQMTVNLKVIDIISVLEYFSSDLNADSRDNILNCKFFAYEIIPEQTENMRMTRKRKIGKTNGEEFTQPQKHILNIFRNCLFMLVYLFIYGSDIQGTAFKNIDKNKFDFLFRSSISRIIISLCINYSKHDIMRCLEYLEQKLLKEEENINESIKRKKTQREKNIFNDYDKLNACKSFLNFITIFVGNFDTYKTSLLSPSASVDDTFNTINDELKTFNHRHLTKQEQKIKDENPTDISKHVSNYFLSENTFFTEIFKDASNYYPYDNNNESILIEFRSFGQNLLIEAGDKSKNVYKNLHEWKSIIESINKSNDSIELVESASSTESSINSRRSSQKPKQAQSAQKTVKNKVSVRRNSI